MADLGPSCAEGQRCGCGVCAFLDNGSGGGAVLFCLAVYDVAEGVLCVRLDADAAAFFVWNIAIQKRSFQPPFSAGCSIARQTS